MAMASNAPYPDELHARPAGTPPRSPVARWAGSPAGRYSGVIVDRYEHVLPAGAERVIPAITRLPVAGLLDPSELLEVEMKQHPRRGLLVTPRWGSWAQVLQAVHALPYEDPPHRRQARARLRGDRAHGAPLKPQDPRLLRRRRLDGGATLHHQPGELLALLHRQRRTVIQPHDERRMPTKLPHE
jgi:hypothetical protein